MGNYNLSTHENICDAAKKAEERAANEPNQGSYNAAWLHGYASALKDVSEQLQEQQKLMDIFFNYIAEHHDSRELYEMLHSGMDLTHDEISFLGFDLPQMYETELEDETPAREYDIDSSVRDWYMEQYPNDDLGPTLNKDLTFRDFVGVLNASKDVYDALGHIDSIVRERVFGMTSQLLGVDYDAVFYRWLGHDGVLVIPSEEKNHVPLEEKVKAAAERAPFESVVPDKKARGR